MAKLDLTTAAFVVGFGGAAVLAYFAARNWVLASPENRANPVSKFLLELGVFPMGSPLEAFQGPLPTAAAPVETAKAMLGYRL